MNYMPWYILIPPIFIYVHKMFAFSSFRIFKGKENCMHILFCPTSPGTVILRISRFSTKTTKEDYWRDWKPSKSKPSVIILILS